LAARSLGLNFTALQNSNLFTNTTGSVANNISALLDGGDLDIRIEALRKLSLSRTLAEPNLVTPELVSPVDQGEASSLPGDDVYEPTDVEFFLSNRLESRRAKDFRSAVRTDFDKQRMPDQCCPDRFIIESSGPTDRLSPAVNQVRSGNANTTAPIVTANMKDNSRRVRQ